MDDNQHQSLGTLYVVATPIGNLEDITYRAIRVLTEVDLVAAEDTRHSRKLFERYGIRKPLISYHDHNERQREKELLNELQTGKNVALISDAGTPCIADPGYRLISTCRSFGIKVEPIPGASAIITALSASGVATDRFSFEGFLPTKSSARIRLLQRLEGEQKTLVFYETPHRLRDALKDLLTVMGEERRVVIAREMTKLHEEFFSAKIAEAIVHFDTVSAKGEIVLILPPGDDAPKIAMRDALRTLLQEGEMSRREAVKLIAKEYGLSSSDVYSASLRLTEEEVDD